MLAKLGSVAKELGLPFGERTMTYNSRMAQEVGKWAEEQGVGDAFHQAVFLTYFRDGANIAQKDVLITVCEQVGLDKKKAGTVMDQRSYRDAVDSDWQRSRQMEIEAVPTFVFGDQRLVGAQSYAALKRMVSDKPSFSTVL